ncbi:NYN domain-containing protein [bacterium]|nr:NYN domain-containing protein [bacterium]
MRKFIAIYIDLENVAGILDLDRLLQDLILEGGQNESEEFIFAVKFACGNSSSITKLRRQLVDHNFDIREAPRVAGKKNRADLIISLDAFEKLYLDKPEVDRFVFITSDSDFSVIMDILRKFGKEVWLVTKEGDEQRPIFTNCTDNILVIPQKGKARPKPKNRNHTTESKEPEQTVKIKETQSARDQGADELFTQVLISLDPSQAHSINVISNKMRQLNKSFKIKNTRYKKMTTLAKEFEKRGWFKTEKHVDGHLMIIDLEDAG